MAIKDTKTRVTFVITKEDLRRIDATIRSAQKGGRKITRSQWLAMAAREKLECEKLFATSGG